MILEQKQQNKTEMNCRFYENEFPNQDDLTVGQVTQVQDNACYVELLEYAGKRGMITPNQYTRSMQKSIHRAMKVGKQEVVRVITVDREKGYIDLSKKKVHPNQQIQTLDKFAKAKTVQSIMRTLSQSLKTNIEQFYRRIAWPIYKSNNTPIEVFKQALLDQKRLDFLELDEATKTKLMAQIRRRFQPPKVKIMSTFEISINDFDGINLIKQALKLGQSKSRKDFELNITILGAPVYLITLQTDKKPEGIKLINEALQQIKKFIEKRTGTYKIKEQPKVVGDKNAYLSEFQKHQQQKVQEGEDSENNDSDMGDASDQEEK